MTDTNTKDEPGDRGPSIEAGVHGSAVAVIRELVEQHFRPSFVRLEDPVSKISVPGMLSKDGVKAVPASVFDDYLPNPRFRTGTAQLTDIASFIEFVQRHSDNDSVIFANDDRARPSVTAIINYNHAGSDGVVDARHGDHRAVHSFPLSDQWKTWSGANGEALSQAGFGRFLEDNVIDVLDPREVTLSEQQTRFVERLGGVGRIGDPAQLVALAMNFAVIDVQTSTTATTLATGEAQLEFRSEHTDGAGQKVNVPTMFVIGVPVFKNGEPYQVLARLRYRLANGKVVFFFELWRLDIIFDHAFAEVVERVKDETGLTVFLGKPERA